MKTLKKMMALMIAVVMCMAMTVTAFADIPTSQTVDPNSAADATGKYDITVAATDTHSYKVYQILTGSLVAGENKLGDPAWGSDAAATSTYATPKAFVDAITVTGLTNVQINDIAKSVLKSDAAGVGIVTNAAALQVVPGYYLLVDETNPLADGDAKSLNIVAVFNDITIAPKKGNVESEKHVADVNDSKSDDHSELKDSADYDIGDKIPYTLTMTLPEDYGNFKQYKIVFTDDMSGGLTYNNDAKIFYGATDTEGQTITFAEDNTQTSAYQTPTYKANGKVYTFTIANLKADDATAKQKALVAGSVIKITYTATLNKNAVIGETGNPNKYKIDFSSNPNQDAGGTPETNETPWDTNIVFTYKTVFNKVDQNKNPLTGADFTLYKFIENTNGQDVYNGKAGTWTDVTTLGSGEDKPKKDVEDLTKGEGATAKTAANAKFTFSGIDAGVYKLVETTTPPTYNTLPDQIFEITATHELVSDDPELTDLTGTDGAQFTMTKNVAEGSLTAEIENKEGTALPSTGGIGTTIFYVLGAILVVGAGVVLVTRRRMSAN